MKKIKLIALLFILIRCSSPIDTITIIEPVHISDDSIVRTGLDVLIKDHPNYLRGRSIGLVTNHTGITKNNEKNYELFQTNSAISLKRIFAPEHGFYGEASAGVKVDYDGKNTSGPEIISLYGKTRKPTKEMLDGIDLIIYDIQDVGARFYTYISTLGLVMEAAGEYGIDVMVLDRPNPIGGEIIEGAILDTAFKSFVGYYPIPIRYALTVGELSQMAVKEGWLTSNPPNLTIVKMDGWKRKMFYDDTNLPWVPPSPNIPDLETAIIYPGMCLYEATNVSEGRGTNNPFKQIGAPWMTYEIAKEMKDLSFEGIDFKYAKFKPKNLPGKAEKPKFENQHCFGQKFVITDRNKFRSVKVATQSIYITFGLYAEHFLYKQARLNKLFGSNQLFQLLRGKLKNSKGKSIKSPPELLKMIDVDCEKFSVKSASYHLYN